MSQWKLPRIGPYEPSAISPSYGVECPAGLPPLQQATEPMQPAIVTQKSGGIYSEESDQVNCMQFAASSDGKRGVWRKRGADGGWKNNPSGETSPDVLAKVFTTHISALKSGNGYPSYETIINLIRLARESLTKGSPHVEETFDAAVWLLDESIRTGHLGNRQLAAKLMVYTNPLLPDVFPPAYKTAEMLRKIIIEQEDDAATHIQAYAGLIHCFLADHIEVTEGLVIFEGLATMGRTEAIREEARNVYWEIADVRSPKLHRRPKPQP